MNRTSKSGMLQYMATSARKSAYFIRVVTVLQVPLLLDRATGWEMGSRVDGAMWMVGGWSVTGKAKCEPRRGEVRVK